MIRIMVSFSDYKNSILIDRVPYKHKNWQLHGILQISAQISIFSSHMQKVVFFSLKMQKITNPLQVTRWNIQNPALKKGTEKCCILFRKSAPYIRMDLNREQEIYQNLNQ